MEQLTTIQSIAVWILPVIFAITVHEVAHGYVAYLLGDKTAKVLGRLSFNPVKHIDLLGTIIVPIALLLLGGIVVGWAKPVPINSRYLKKPKRDLALIAVAGPSANLLMLLFWGAIAKIGMLLVHAFNAYWAEGIMYMGIAGININLILLLINLLPIPPLDGGHVISGLLPKKIARRFERIAPFGFFLILFLVAVGAIGFLLGPILTYLLGLVSKIFGL